MDYAAAVRPEVLARQIGPKLFPKVAYEDLLKCPKKMKAMRQEYSELPFFAYMKACQQGQFLKTFVKIEKPIKPKKLSAAQILKAKEAEELKILEEASKANKIAAKETNQTAVDLAYLKQTTAICTLEYVNPIHHNLALYLFLYCIGIRETLFQNILLRYSQWLKKNNVPEFDLFAKHFNPDATIENIYSAQATVVQVVRSLVVSNFSVRARIITDKNIQTPFIFNVSYQKLYVDARLRQFSLALLDSTLLDRKQKEFVDLFESIQYFESFVSGADFNAFRMAFPVPKITDWPSEPLESVRNSNAIDFILVHALSGIKPSIKMSAKWSSYMDTIMKSFENIRTLWKTNLEILESWLCDATEVPCIKEFDDDFRELFNIYFGNLQVSKWQPNKKLEDLFFYISFLAKQKFGSKKQSVDLEEAALVFILTPSDLMAYTEKIQPLNGCVFPFSRSLEQIWKPLFEAYQNDTYGPKIKQNWNLVKKGRSLLLF